MNVNFDKFDQMERPAITLCNPNKSELYSLSAVIYNTKLIQRFNALSEFNFEIPETIDGGETAVESYDFIQAKRLINIDGVGYFIIDKVEEKTEGDHPYKSVESKSLEAELLNRRLTAFSGTYKLYNPIPVPGQTTLMDAIISIAPTWSVGHVDTDIAIKYRTFEVNDSTVYGFMINELEKAFECVVLFDTVNKEINIYNLENATDATSIFLSYDNVVKNSSFTEITDEIVTALYVYGEGTLDIRAVNPYGTNVIYNFDYYKTTDWMTQGLIDALNTWEAFYDSVQPNYANALTQLRLKNGELIILQSELDQLESQYTVKETELKTLIELGEDISAVNAELKAIQVLIDAKNVEITAKEADISNVLDYITYINSQLTFDQNFTQEQIDELNGFIFENTYQNNTLVVTDLTTQVEYQDTAQELYDQAVNVLSRSSLPRYEFQMDTANFIALKEFEAFTDELSLGCTVTIPSYNGTYTIVPVLLEIQMSYDNPQDFSLTFSNRLRLDNGNFQYSDLFGQTISTASTVSANNQQWSNWSQNYKNTVSEFITSALNASLNSVINAENQEIVINTNGLKGRTYLPETEDYDPHQVWLTSSLLAFTSDGWDSARLALGKIEYNGNELYGLVGERAENKSIEGIFLCF